MLSMAMMNSVVDQKQKRGRRPRHNHSMEQQQDTTTTTTNNNNNTDNSNNNNHNVKHRLRKSRTRANQDLETLEYNQSVPGMGGLAYTSTTTTTTTTSTSNTNNSNNSSQRKKATTTPRIALVPNPLQEMETTTLSSHTEPSPQHPRTSSVSVDTMEMASSSSSSVLPPPNSNHKMVNFGESTILYPPNHHQYTNNTSSSSNSGNRLRGFSIDLDCTLYHMCVCVLNVLLDFVNDMITQHFPFLTPLFHFGTRDSSGIGISRRQFDIRYHQYPDRFGRGPFESSSSSS